MNKAELRALFKVSFTIAILIFFTSVFSDFSVKMYNSENSPFIRVLIALIAIAIMTLVIMFALWWIPDIRKAISRMFGIDETEQ